MQCQAHSICVSRSARAQMLLSACVYACTRTGAYIHVHIPYTKWSAMLQSAVTQCGELHTRDGRCLQIIPQVRALPCWRNLQISTTCRGMALLSRLCMRGSARPARPASQVPGDARHGRLPHVPAGGAGGRHPRGGCGEGCGRVPRARRRQRASEGDGQNACVGVALRAQHESGRTPGGGGADPEAPRGVAGRGAPPGPTPCPRAGRPAARVSRTARVAEPPGAPHRLPTL